MRSPFVRSLLALGLVVLAVVGWPRPDPVVAHARRVHAASTPTFGFAALPGAYVAPYTSYVADGGAMFAAYDGGTPAPISTTGVFARALTARLCPAAARILCTARDRFACGPIDPNWDEDENDDEPPRRTCTECIEQSCDDWVARHYGGFDDALEVGELALARCLDMFDQQSRDGEALVMDASCDDLAVLPERSGEPCDTPWMPCADDTLCIDGRCDDRGGRGDACIDSFCRPGLACVLGLCDAPTQLGGACDDDSVCTGRDVFCYDGVCASSVRDGDDCELDVECAIGSSCEDARCVRVDRTACTLEAECGRGRTCAGEYAAHCERPPNIDDTCATENDCGPWLECVGGRCRLAHPPVVHGHARVGQACETTGPTDSCLVGLGCRWGASGYRCEVAAAEGESCDDGHACASELMCLWRVVDGHCGAAFCAASDYFADQGEE